MAERETCESVNVVAQSDHLTLVPCVRDRGHRGSCTDREGRRWVRLDEVLRERGLRLAGSRVQRIREE